MMYKLLKPKDTQNRKFMNKWALEQSCWAGPN